MDRRYSYNTKQKNIILNTIKNINHEFTVKDIYKELDDKIGLTTIYRFMDKLVKDGLVNKFIKDNNTTYYEYLEKCDKSNHFYLKCDKCKNIIHIDCDCINELSIHILNKHGFTINKNNIIIGGICRECVNSKKELVK